MRILDLDLVTTSFSQLADFYTQVLGFPAVQPAADTLVLQAGVSRLTFRIAPGPAAFRYHFAFNIPEHQFAQAALWLRERTPLLADSTGTDEFYSTEWNSHGVYFYDPGGNVVELIARHNLPAPSGAPFSAVSVLGISEIGIAAEDVEAQVNAICARSGAAVFHGPPSPTFTAVGDDLGLFIVVRRGRIWFPDSGVGAEPVPISIVTGSRTNPIRWQFA